MSRSALESLAEYGCSSSSDDDVPGCRVSTKRMHKDDEDCILSDAKRFERLPPPVLPIEINQVGSVIDDPSLHDGRVRGFAHERGNWATYVYIPIEKNEGIEKLLNDIVFKNLPELKPVEDFHVSLTKTVALKYHWIEPFLNTLKENLANFIPFALMFNSFSVYCNEEKTRTFIGLEIKTGVDTLIKLVESLDLCLTDFNLPIFYQNPSFHLSIAWCLGDCREKISTFLPELDSILQVIMNSDCSELQWNMFYVQQIMCKIGNKLCLFDLTHNK